jgi:hypothetical protein
LRGSDPLHLDPGCLKQLADGVFAQVDVTTRDGTTTDMTRADF